MRKLFHSPIFIIVAFLFLIISFNFITSYRSDSAIANIEEIISHPPPLVNDTIFNNSPAQTFIQGTILDFFYNNQPTCNNVNAVIQQYRFLENLDNSKGFVIKVSIPNTISNSFFKNSLDNIETL